MFICRLIKYDKEGYARIGVMPRYGNAESVKWFDVETNCTLHILNSFEDKNEVIPQEKSIFGLLSAYSFILFYLFLVVEITGSSKRV